MKNKSILFLLATAFLLTACSDANNEPEPSQLSSVYVMNQGNFSDSNGSVSSYDPENETAITNAFQDANGRPFAGIIQSATIIDDQMFLISNNSNKIEVVDPTSLSSVGTIEYSKTPVHIAPAGNNRAYVSNLFDNSVSVIDLNNLEETGQTIPVGIQPAHMIQVGNFVFVSNSGGVQTGTVDNTISVIDTQTNTVVNSIEVADKPGKMVVDSSNRIWLICSGLTAYDENFERVPEEDTPGGLFVIDAEMQMVAQSTTLDERPFDIELNERNSQLFLLNDNIETVDMATLQIGSTAFVDRSFNSIGFSSAQGMLYAGQSNGFTQPGQAVQYNLEGTAIDSFDVGISPVDFEFIAN